MGEPITLERIETLVGQLTPREQLKLLVQIGERLSDTFGIVPEGENEQEQQVQDERLRLARALCEEVEDIANDAHGEFDAADDIRRLREERIRQLCRSGA
jgi:hypothetical protein